MKKYTQEEVRSFVDNTKCIADVPDGFIEVDTRINEEADTIYKYISFKEPISISFTPRSFDTVTYMDVYNLNIVTTQNGDTITLLGAFDSIIDCYSFKGYYISLHIEDNANANECSHGIMTINTFSEEIMECYNGINGVDTVVYPSVVLYNLEDRNYEFDVNYKGSVEVQVRMDLEHNYDFNYIVKYDEGSLMRAKFYHKPLFEKNIDMFNKLDIYGEHCIIIHNSRVYVYITYSCDLFVLNDVTNSKDSLTMIPVVDILHDYHITHINGYLVHDGLMYYNGKCIKDFKFTDIVAPRFDDSKLSNIYNTKELCNILESDDPLKVQVMETLFKMKDDIIKNIEESYSLQEIFMEGLVYNTIETVFNIEYFANL